MLSELDGRAAGRRLPVPLPADFEPRDLDVAPDGSELVLERAQEHSDLALVELRPPARALTAR